MGDLNISKKQQQVQHNKKQLLLALEESLGVVTAACRAVKLDRTTFYSYVNSDPEFAKAVKSLDDVALDFAEDCLHKQIQAGVPASTIFYLKTKGKNRGYIERIETSSSVDIQTEIAKYFAQQGVDEPLVRQVLDEMPVQIIESSKAS